MSKKEIIVKDPLKVYEEIHKLIMQAYYVEMVRQNAEKFFLEAIKKDNNVKIFSYFALQSYSIIQFWKLFDPKSTFNMNEVMGYVSYPELKKWFDNEIKSIASDVENLNIWRHNFVGHRSKFGYYNSKEFEKKFKESFSGTSCGGGGW